MDHVILNNPHPIMIAQVEPPQETKGGDYYYRTYAPSLAMSIEDKVFVVNLTNENRVKSEVFEQADVLILKNICDPDLLTVIKKRRSKGKPTIYEIADDLSALEPWNPVHFFYQDEENQSLIRRLAGFCDALQVTCPKLKSLYGYLNLHCKVFPNQVSHIPPARKMKRDGNMVIGWGGSHGHLKDMSEIADHLINWVMSRSDVSLHLMCSESIWRLFDRLPEPRKRHITTGSIEDYYKFLSGIDIGIAPLMNTAFNRSRSDVKFLEYAAAGVVPVMKRLEPYLKTVAEGRTGYLVDDCDQMISILDHLVNSPELVKKIGAAAQSYVLDNRTQSGHAKERVAFYRQVFSSLNGKRSSSSMSDGELFDRWSNLEGAVVNGRHMGLESTKFESLLHDGLVAMQVMDDRELALTLFNKASALEPSNYLPYLFGAQVSYDPIGWLHKAVERNQDSLKACILLSGYFARSGKIKKALKCLESAANIFPDYDIPYLRAGTILKKAGRKQEADKLLTMASKLAILIHDRN